jgi:hypothetical protein
MSRSLWQYSVRSVAPASRRWSPSPPTLSWRSPPPVAGASPQPVFKEHGSVTTLAPPAHTIKPGRQPFSGPLIVVHFFAFFFRGQRVRSWAGPCGVRLHQKKVQLPAIARKVFGPRCRLLGRDCSASGYQSCSATRFVWISSALKKQVLASREHHRLGDPAADARNDLP